MTINPDAALRRESARTADGTFGHQQHAEAAVTLTEQNQDRSQAIVDIASVADELAAGQRDPATLVKRLGSVLGHLKTYPEDSEARAQGSHLVSPLVGAVRLWSSESTLLSEKWVQYAAPRLDETRRLLEAPAPERAEPALRYTGYLEDEREQILAGLAEGRNPEQVFGPERSSAARRLHAWLAGIAPTQDERGMAAWGYGDAKRIAAYDRGRHFMGSAYQEYGHLQMPHTVPGRPPRS